MAFHLYEPTAIIGNVLPHEFTEQATELVFSLLVLVSNEERKATMTQGIRFPVDERLDIIFTE
ncbi:MAG TPA: hypothetical protein PLW14_06475 [Chlorobiota bacterium]|nr:hypothetical protein [Chlorobiota bacterium]